MFLVEKELDAIHILKIVSQFETQEKPRLNKLWNYYMGKQDILYKRMVDPCKPNNRIITNYCENIVENYRGYLTGLPITYITDNEQIQDILNYNDYKQEDSEFLRQALIFGRAFEINYIDRDNKQRFKTLETRQCIPVYDTTIEQELLYVIRYYPVDSVMDSEDAYIIEVYGKDSTRTFKSSLGFASATLVSEVPNYFNQVPISVFSLNQEERSIFENIITLQDAYNKLVSSEVDDFEAFCDAYLCLKGINCDPEDLALMKENRVLLLDADSDAQYLTKSVSDTQIVDMLQRVNDNIHKIANSPDFNDEKFLSQSGIAMRYKLVGFENNASSIEGQMIKALQKRMELIFSIFSIKGDDWADVNIVFNRNLPVNNLETAQVINQLRGIVSNETLLSQLSFIKDVQEELEKVTAEKQANMELYAFNPSIGSENE